MRLALVVLAVLLIGYWVLGASSSLRTKLVTIAVQTPHGVVQGSSAIEIATSRAPWWFPTGTGNRNSGTQRGEAPYVDLGGGRYLLVALNDPLRRPLWQLFSDRHLNADGTFKPGSEPLLITFSGIDDANSVRKVAPHDLADAFGPGYRLLRLTATDARSGMTLGTLARKFPKLHRQLTQPAAERLRAAGLQAGGPDDVRFIGWDALEQTD